MIKRGSQTLVFVVAFLTWLLLTWKVEAWSILIGLFISFLSALFFGELFTAHPERALQPARYLWFLYYVPVFLWEMIKVNIDVAYRVLHPKLPVSPGIVKIKTNLKGEVSKVFLANSLTIATGALTIDVKENVFYIHWLDIKSKDTEKVVQALSEKFEKILMRVFE